MSADFLTKVRALVARGDCSGAGSRDAKGRMLIISMHSRETDLYCITGACHQVGLETGDQEAHAAAICALHETLHSPVLLTRWNDAHSLQDRLDLIDDTIAREKLKIC